MKGWRSRVLFGVGLAALAIAVVPFEGGATGERALIEKIADVRSSLSRALLARELNQAEAKLSADTASLISSGFSGTATASLEPTLPPELTFPAPPPPPAPPPAALEPPAAAVEAPTAPAPAGPLETPAPPAPAGPLEAPAPPAAAGSLETPVAPAPPAPPSAAAPALSPAAIAYSKGDAAALASLSKGASDPDERIALEWAALRIDPHPSVVALGAFAEAHPGWPGARYVRLREEGELLLHASAPSEVVSFFAQKPPESSAGSIALARAYGAMGRADEAIRSIRALWRDGNFDAWTESQILREFSASLLKADHKYRADRLLYAESFGPALRAAALAGPDVVSLAEARMSAAHGPLNQSLLKAVPPALRGDPGLLYARVQDARRSNRAFEAATLLNLAPTDRTLLVSPDKWWAERRMVARELLDLNEPKLAYEICDRAAQPDDPAAQVDADFHAGWIALRFLKDAPAAAKRFALAAEAAETPLSIARASYWRGRAAEAMGDAEEAKLHYQNAATEPIAYYGQLAAERIGYKRLPLREPVAAAEGPARDEAVRTVEALYVDGLDALASALAFEAAREWRDEAQLAAMAEVVKRHGDASTQLQFGKIATIRGYAFDKMAFPSDGVPAYLPLARSADLASVYAVARQESEFIWRASSGAGAKGLMQIMPATAASFAKRMGLIYDPMRLVADPSFNTQLGAAFLGQVLDDEGGSRELAFAAYNAGGGRVAQWIAAYGDPRTGAADLVDWVERIPFDETRDYVQRVVENLNVYKQLFAQSPPPQKPVSAFAARE
jgi:soluble lytic murein transglycosylase